MLQLDQAALDAYLEEFLEPHAHAGAVKLMGLLDQEGTGQQHEDLPNRSSAEGEYPVVQFGHLLQSISAEREGRLTYGIGSYQQHDAQGYDEAVELETRPPSRGGRDFLEMAEADPEFLAAILEG